jgi:hypothetical protein
MRVLIHDYGLHGLIPGLNWLSAQRPAAPESPSILHLDFHPLNLVHGQGFSLVVLRDLTRWKWFVLSAVNGLLGSRHLTTG